MLFAALASAFPDVRFEAREAGAWSGLDALIELGGAEEARGAAAADVRALAALRTEAESGPPVEVRFTREPGLDRRLHDCVLPDRHLAGLAALAAEAGTSALASSGEGPLWTRAGRLDAVAVAPAELMPGEPLRDRLRRGRSLALLPLLELLRELTREEGWQPPPLRAAFLLDDPNLRWRSYGYLSLPRLSRHAEEHGYHLALAMVPLDARIAYPPMARLLRRQPAISLLVHGNDHFGGELGRAGDETAALALAAQALRRIAAFERRTGVSVARVMVPPHEECSEPMTRALARSGFAAISMTRPYPWLSPPPRHWLTAPAGSEALAGWLPADLTPAGLPVMLRHPLADQHHSQAEVTLRAYLDQPLILYGHHDDLAEGMGILARRAAEVDRLGPVRWGSLAELAAANVAWRREGELLRLRPYSRQIATAVPAGVERVVVEPVAQRGEAVETPTGTVPVGEPFAVAGSGFLELRLRHPDAVDPADVSPPTRRPWPLVRRLAGETRDRVAPVRRRLRIGP